MYVYELVPGNLHDINLAAQAVTLISRNYNELCTLHQNLSWPG